MCIRDRFYDAQKGKIIIGGNNVRDYEIESLRNKISLVLQDVFLFADTILNNITLFNKNISFDYVIDSAKKIGIHDFIMSLPGGYNYNVKERGVMLSQGQRQLISFLRAYIKNPSILILDEATSSIDSNSEELIQAATQKITENKTSIIIAHRLSTILNSDRIIQGSKVDGAYPTFNNIADGSYAVSRPVSYKHLRAHETVLDIV